MKKTAHVFKYRTSSTIAIVTVLMTLLGCTDNRESDSAGSNVINGICGESISTADLTDIRIGHSAFAAPTLQWGINQGCFAEAGLNVIAQQVRGPEAAAGISSGSLDVMSASPRDAVTLFANAGFESRIISAHTGVSQEDLDRAKQEPLYPGEFLLQTAMFVRNDSPVKSPADLRNVTIGSNVTVGNVANTVRRTLSHFGINDEDILLIEVPQESIHTAIQNGDIGAGVVSGRYMNLALESGLRLIAYPGAYGFDAGTITAWITERSVLEEKADLVRSFRKATKRIAFLLTDPSNEASWRQVLVDHLQFDPEVANQTVVPDYWTKDVTLEELQNLGASLLEAGEIKEIPALAEMLFD